MTMPKKDEAGTRYEADVKTLLRWGRKLQPMTNGTMLFVLMVLTGSPILFIFMNLFLVWRPE